MKKLLAVLLVMALCVGCASAEEARHKIVEGTLAYAGMPVDEYDTFLDEYLNNNVWDTYINNNPVYLTTQEGSRFYKREMNCA